MKKLDFSLIHQFSHAVLLSLGNVFFFFFVKKMFVLTTLVTDACHPLNPLENIGFADEKLSFACAKQGLLLNKNKKQITVFQADTLFF